MSSTGHNDKMIEVLSGSEHRRRTPQEKIVIVQQTMEPSMTVSNVARLHGVNVNQVFTWRLSTRTAILPQSAPVEKLYRPLNSTAVMKQIQELQRLLGKKTMEVELLKEAMGVYGRAKKMDSARALASLGYGLTLISRCLKVSWIFPYKIQTPDYSLS